MGSTLYPNVDLEVCNLCKCYYCERDFGTTGGFYIMYCTSYSKSHCSRCNRVKQNIFIGKCPEEYSDLDIYEREV